MTLDEELALIRKNRRPPDDTPADPAAQPADAAETDTPTPAMLALSATYQEAVKPAPAPPPKTAAEIDAELGLPPRQTGLAPLPEQDAGFWDVVQAGWRAETIRTDAWNDTEVRRRAQIAEMLDALPEAEAEAIRKKHINRRGIASWAALQRATIEATARVAQSGAEGAARLSGYPMTEEAFTDRLNEGRLADLEEHEAILGQPGGGIAEFIGAGARARNTGRTAMAPAMRRTSPSSMRRATRSPC